MLPSDDAFVAAEAGVRLFPLTFRTTGNQTVTATDVAARSITGSEAVSVTPRPFYVANFNGNSATVYAAGATGNATPIATIAGSNTGLTSPQGIAVDAAGRLYVANIANPYTITIYASGATGNATPAATIAGSNTGLSQPEGIALDAAGRLYVATLLNTTVTVYAAGAAGNATPTVTIAGNHTALNTPDTTPL